MTEKKIEEALEEPKGIPEDVAADLMKIENRIQRDIAIKEASKRLGASIGAIKAELERRIKKRSNGNARVLEFSAAKIASAPSLDETLQNVSGFMGRFISYPSENARVAHTLWVAHCHLMEAWYTTPRLAFMSAEKASGKTRALEVTELLVPNSILSINASPAAIVTHVSAGAVTILHDEIDNVFGSAKSVEANADLCAILNGGYRRGAAVYRCVMQGKARELEKLEAFCPVAIAGLKTLPDTLASRSIFIRMRRRAPGESVEQFRQRKIRPQAQALFDALALRCREIERAMATVEPKMPDSITDRDAECWEPLFAVADAAGGDWPGTARIAAVGLIAGAADAILSDGVELLQHIREAFGTESKVWTSALVNSLCSRDESPWKDIRGRDLGDRGLAEMLKPYGIKSRDVWVTGKTKKGYYAADFHDAWKRYLAPFPHPLSDESDESEVADNPRENIAPIAPIAPSPKKVREPDMGDESDESEESYNQNNDLTDIALIADREGESSFPDLPDFMDRRKPHSSPASEPGTKVPIEVTMALLRGEKGAA